MIPGIKSKNLFDILDDFEKLFNNYNENNKNKINLVKNLISDTAERIREGKEINLGEIFNPILKKLQVIAGENYDFKTFNNNNLGEDYLVILLSNLDRIIKSSNLEKIEILKNN